MHPRRHTCSLIYARHWHHASECAHNTMFLMCKGKKERKTTNGYQLTPVVYLFQVCRVVISGTYFDFCSCLNLSRPHPVATLLMCRSIFSWTKRLIFSCREIQKKLKKEGSRGKSVPRVQFHLVICAKVFCAWCQGICHKWCHSNFEVFGVGHTPLSQNLKLPPPLPMWVTPFIIGSLSNPVAVLGYFS